MGVVRGRPRGPRHGRHRPGRGRGGARGHVAAVARPGERSRWDFMRSAPPGKQCRNCRRSAPWTPRVDREEDQDGPVIVLVNLRELRWAPGQRASRLPTHFMDHEGKTRAFAGGGVALPIAGTTPSPLGSLRKRAVPGPSLEGDEPPRWCTPGTCPRTR